jgi:hypothetical protein
MLLTKLLLAAIAVGQGQADVQKERAFRSTLADQSAPPVVASRPIDISWNDNFLTVRGQFPGREIKILYLEAYCRAGSTDRDWRETVIPAKSDEIVFELVAHNPTDQVSHAHWAQPCMRVDKFTGAGAADARELVPGYAKKCFLFVNGRLTRLPTTPWAKEARYTPGQVFCPQRVDRGDVNPRPLSPLIPSSSLCGCLSADEQTILAVAWEPYQEIFQGVVACIHCDFRLGGLGPGETKRIRGKLYIVPADVPRLIARHKLDFPEQYVSD